MLVRAVLALCWVNIGVFASLPPTLAPTSFVSQYNYIVRAAGSSTSATLVTVGGRATSCNLVGPKGIWQDSMGIMYVVDTDANCVLKFDMDGDTILQYYAGKCATAGNTGLGGQATAATLDEPSGFRGDSSGNTYIVDFNSYLVKKVSSGIISKFAGDGTTSAPVYGRPATSCAINGISDVYADTMGVVYTVQTNCQVSRVDSSGIISLVAGDDFAVTKSSVYCAYRSSECRKHWWRRRTCYQCEF